jgi:hypothetical protein
MRTDNDTYRSLNESINAVQNPQVALHEAQEYASVLEEALQFVCEELEITPDELMEMAMTAAREKELRGAMSAQSQRRQKAYKAMHADGATNIKKKEKAFRRERDADLKLTQRYGTEGMSKRLYGKGGKVVKRK